MYTKEEVSKQKQAFWTAFGKYMKPVLSADGNIISWSNYKTGIPGMFFRIDADNKTASVAIAITQADMDLHRRLYEQLTVQRSVLEEILGEDDWSWQSETTDDYGKTISTISKRIAGVSVMNEADWPAIISFFKPRMMALDEFWSMAKYGFEALL
ncbi:DUF4268 domain-containing protein [Chitinophaga sp. Cy-1792]|uniref:DUF4268 domain-containing protein n=1 Tax=Chitinophaga sp. Cy-1792 TaxID=2608339 RepID=UPI00141DB4B3|nr:DUF4268 domain-containing protein [Chitinophaga sp. Cy-1792]NIG54087.1 DUF4268 domain-containing protein [Chitinophaga sp. Cy-1792]